MPPGGSGLAVGDEVEVETTAFAHGGHCVARHDGQVLFVRHTLPGERVLARVTEVGSGSRFVRADAVEVRHASDDRVVQPCPWSGPGACGGCDLQHVSLTAQRRLKAGVVAEQMSRLAHLEVDVEVEPVPGDHDGLGWRTRVEFAVDGSGRAGLRRHRSHEVVPVDRCRIASDGVTSLHVTGSQWPGVEAVDAVAPSLGEPVAVEVPGGAVPDVVERVAASWPGADGPVSFERDFTVSARGFWQVHPGAAATFLAAALGPLVVRPGERALDLYCGVGLFASALSEAVGPSGQVVAVEADRDAVERATRDLSALGNVAVVGGRVDDLLGLPRTDRHRGRSRARRPVRSPLLPQRADVVVLDPPRTGAGTAVVTALAAMGPRAVAYVACDPAALARDTAAFADAGYRLAGLRAFDAFPMTHHVECVAHFEPARA